MEDSERETLRAHGRGTQRTAGRETQRASGCGTQREPGREPGRGTAQLSTSPSDPTERHITKIAREAQKLVIHTMKETGIGSGELDLIHFVRHHPGASQKQVAAELNMDKGAVARRVAGLERKGYLYRRPNPDDGRSSLLFATGQAEDLKLSKAGVEAAFYGWLVEELPEEERAAFLRTLDTLYRRSKRESRAGFPHVSTRLAGEMPGPDPAADSATAVGDSAPAVRSDTGEATVHAE